MGNKFVDIDSKSYDSFAKWMIAFLIMAPILELHYKLIWTQETFYELVDQIFMMGSYDYFVSVLLLPLIGASLWLCAKKQIYGFPIFGFLFFFAIREKFFSTGNMIPVEGYVSTEILMLVGALGVYMKEFTEVILKALNIYELFVQRDPAILIVDDDSDARAYYKRMFKEYGMEVWVAKDRDSAMEYLKRKSFDCVLMDFFLQNDTGKDIVQALKRNPKTQYLPVVGISASDIKDNDKTMFTRFISKRQPVEDTLGVVKSCIRTYALSRSAHEQQY